MKNRELTDCLQPQNERAKVMRALGKATWDLETLLGLHLGLLDHAEDVRIAAMRALQHIAQRKPDPIAISPAALLGYFMHSFTAASGMSPAVLQCIVELNMAESPKMVEAILESGQGSNMQFEGWVSLWHCWAGGLLESFIATKKESLRE